VTFARFVDAVEWVVAGLAATTVLLLFVAQPTVASGAADVEEGAGVFATNCAGCHASDRSGGVGPALVGSDALERFDDSESVSRFVAVGVPGRMPGFETRLTPDEIGAVAGYVFSGLGS
jgi:mono/diheme cytochrome c family protein